MTDQTIDNRTQDAHDTILQQELLGNERVVVHPTFGPVRLRRPNADQERKIANERRRQYHADLKDESILSREEIERLAVNRGLWQPGTKDRLQLLMVQTGQAMGLLDKLGFKSVGDATGAHILLRQQLMDLYEESHECQEALIRYFDLDTAPKSEDRMFLSEHAPNSTAEELLDKTDTLRTQIDLLVQMTGLREELNTLLVKQNRLFADSLEARADRAEELATIYFCSEMAETGEPLWPSLEAMWKARNPADVTWLIQEMHFFLNGVEDHMRDILGKFGFLQRLSGTSDSSDDSLDQPTSNSDGASADAPANPS